MARLLVTGASGVLGWTVARMARQYWDVFGTVYRTKRSTIEAHFGDISVGRIDLSDFRAMREMLDAVKPDAVIHTAALSDANVCQSHPADSLRINVEATANLAGLCADRAIGFVFTSTDLVFDGSRAPYAEDDPVSPISTYGEHKALAEMEVCERYPLGAVCRLPLLFGPPSPSHGSFFVEMVRRMRAGEELRLFEDEYRTPLSTLIAARALLEVAYSATRPAGDEGVPRITGVIHLGGRERVSRFELGQLIQELLQTSAHLQPVSLDTVPMAAPRPRDVSLQSPRWSELRVAPPSLREQLEALFSARSSDRAIQA